MQKLLTLVTKNKRGLATVCVNSKFNSPEQGTDFCVKCNYFSTGLFLYEHQVIYFKKNDT